MPYQKFVVSRFLFLGYLCVHFLLPYQVFAQRNYDLFWVGFADKAQTPYSLWKPQEFLSARALERRARFGIRVDSSDLPLSPAYLKALNDQKVRIFHQSRWENGVVVLSTRDSIQMIRQNNPFVKEVLALGFKRAVQAPAELEARDKKNDYRKKSDFHGGGANQIEMLNGDYLHQLGYRGAGMQVAVFDGGFSGYRETPAFDSLMQTHRLLGTKDFVEGDDFVFESDDHGHNVLSTMAANLPYLFVGTAPDASFYLFKTEDEAGEYLIEQYNWLAAAEYADILGVDVINSSLGYNQFEDRLMNIAYADLDGNTTLISRAADMASKKGILVVSSAGNEGTEKWKHINAPSDADSVLTVGAVDRDGYYANFSSKGFPKNNRQQIKPNITARGAQAIVAAKSKYDTRQISGTSFSAPIIAGMATSLWGALPSFSNMGIIRLLEGNASQSTRPDNLLGYGIPDFLKSYQKASNSVIFLEKADRDTPQYLYLPTLYPERVDIFIDDPSAPEISAQLFNQLGVLLSETTQKGNKGSRSYLRLKDWADYPEGVYYLYLRVGKHLRRIVLCK